MHSAGFNVQCAVLRFSAESALLGCDDCGRWGRTRGVCQAVCRTVSHADGSILFLAGSEAAKQQAPSCACDPCARQDPLRLPTATSLDWERLHPVNVSQAIRLPAFAQLQPRTKLFTKSTARLHPLYDLSDELSTRNPHTLPRLTQCLLLQATTAPGSPTSTSVCTLRPSSTFPDTGGTRRRRLHITRATTADLGTVKMGAMMGGSTCPLTLPARWLLEPLAPCTQLTCLPRSCRHHHRLHFRYSPPSRPTPEFDYQFPSTPV